MTDRMRALLAAGIALSSELSLDSLLERVTRTAAELTGARYAALGVLDAAGQELERFVTHGIDPETHAAIGMLPRGRGILGVLIWDANPLRLHDLSEDPRSVPWVNLAVIFLVVYAVALATTWAPALRASRVYPAEALRYE